MSAGYQTQCMTSLLELERARDSSLVAEWEELIAQDPTANFFQSPAWSMAWYQSYCDQFSPLIVSVRHGDSLVGLVPLALDINTGHLVFAGAGMSDYRDVVAKPQHRKGVIVELLEFYRDGNYPNPLQLGYTQPESESVNIVVALSGFNSGIHTIVRSHPCYRFYFGSDSSSKSLTSKESVRRRINHYRREGKLGLVRVESDEAWKAIRGEFYDQHSLRQMYVGRLVSFHDFRKRAFYDRLFQDSRSSVHFSKVHVGERMVAAHYGFLWRDLLYWGAPSFDIREEKYSPGQVMLALLIQSAEASGLRGVDLTIGTEEFKRRFANSRVNLPTAEIYPRSRQYYARRLRDKTVTLAKSLVKELKGEQEWSRITETIREGLAEESLGDEPNVLAIVGKLAKRATLAVGERSRWLSFVKTFRDQEHYEPVLISGLVLHENHLRDLLRWDGRARDVKRKIRETVKKAPALLRDGYKLHTGLLDDRLAGWCWSYRTREPIRFEDIKTPLECSQHSVVLEHFYLIPDFGDTGLGSRFLTQIQRSSFIGGARSAFIRCDENDLAVRSAIESAGFHLLAADQLVRLFRWKRVRRRLHDVNDQGSKPHWSNGREFLAS